MNTEKTTPVTAIVLGASGRGKLYGDYALEHPEDLKIVGIADRWATWIVVIALSAAAITWAVTGQIIRAVTILGVQPVLLFI